jgi:ADP-ribose pyrophosphatase
MAANDKPDKARDGDFEIVDLQTAFQGYFRVDSYRLRHRLFGGGWSGSISREVFERGHAIAAILYDPVCDSLVFVEQFRTGALAAQRDGQFDPDFSPWLVEICAGIIEPGESAEEVARREITEETGCEVLDIFPVMKYLASPGCLSETQQLFCARVIAPPDGGIHGLEHEDEDIRVKVASVDEALSWIDSPNGQNVMTLVALQWFKLHRDEIYARWGARHTPEPQPRALITCGGAASLACGPPNKQKERSQWIFATVFSMQSAIPR